MASASQKESLCVVLSGSPAGALVGGRPDADVSEVNAGSISLSEGVSAREVVVWTLGAGPLDWAGSLRGVETLSGWSTTGGKAAGLDAVTDDAEVVLEGAPSSDLFKMSVILLGTLCCRRGSGTVAISFSG